MKKQSKKNSNVIYRKSSIFGKIRKEYLVEETIIKELNDPQFCFNFVDTMLIVLGKDQSVLKINKKGCEILGYPEKEIIGKKYFDTFIPERFRKEMKEFFNELVSGKKILRRYFENPVLTRTGERLISWRNMVLKDKTGQIIGTISEGRDITEERKKEQELIQKEKRARALFETAPAGYICCSIQGKICDVNKTFTDMSGFCKEELIGKFFSSLIPQHDRKSFNRMVEILDNTGHTGIAEFKLNKKDGTTFDVYCTARIPGSGMIQVLVYDISHRTILNIFQKVEAQMNDALNQSMDVSSIVSSVSRILRKNFNFYDCFIRLKQETRKPGKSRIERQIAEFFSGHLQGDSHVATSTIIKTKKDQKELFAALVPVKSPQDLVGVIVCLDKRKSTFSSEIIKFLENSAKAISIAFSRCEAYKLLQDTLANQNAFLDATDSMAFVKDADFRYISLNTAYAKFFKKSPDEILGKTDFELMEYGTAKRCRETDQQAKKEEKLVINEEIVGNRIYETRKFPVKLATGQTGVGAFVRDITEIKKAQQKIENLMWMYSMLYQVNQAIVRVKNSDDLFKTICEIACREGKFTLAWIGIVDYEKNIVIPVAGSRQKRSYYENIKISLDPFVPEGNGPTGRAIRTGRICICNNILEDERMKAWWQKAKKYGFCFSAAVPIRVRNNIIGTLNLYSAQPHFFNRDVKKLLLEVSSDIALCIEKLNAEEIRKKTEDKLRENELHLRAIFDYSPYPAVEIDGSQLKTKLKKINLQEIEKYFAENPEIIDSLKNSIKILNSNRQIFEFFNTTDNEKLSELLSTVIVKPEIIKGLFSEGKCERIQTKIDIGGNIRKEFFINAIILPKHEKDWSRLLVCLIDITDLVYMEQNLRATLSRFQGFFDTAVTGMGILDLEGKPIALNKRICEILGYEHEELMKMKLVDVVPPEDRQSIKELYEKLAKGEITSYETRERKYVKKDGSIVWAYVSGGLIFDHILKKHCVTAVVVDRTKQEQYLRQLERIQNLLKACANCNEIIAKTRQEEREMLVSICKELGKASRGFSFVILKDGSDFDVITYSEADAEFLSELKKLFVEQLRCPTVNALHEKRTLIVDDIAGSDYSEGWKKLVSQHGFRSVAAFPIIFEGSTIGSLSIYSSDENIFREENEVAIIRTIAENIGYGVTLVRARKEKEIASNSLQRSYQQLQEAMEGIASAIAKITETRDPYTAGHQIRVAKLSIAIAREMGLAENIIEGIRIAGILHDIGKINVPVEILVKPGKLSDDEFSIIKLHSVVGYEILRQIPFPWNVAKIVLQHHERLNGSGYPDGIVENDILQEAKIIAVADVVEAMAYDRPYRPALGIDVALAEIKNKSGILFDPEVVDICIRLFKEKDFSFD
ncbi:MAG: PAS domain S-box protein [Candidatus Ratteibacteria bacterium]